MKKEGVCFQFDTIEVSPHDFAVRRDGERLDLEPKAIRVLIHLLRNRDRVVTKEELVGAVWEGATITDNAVTRVVAQLRRELGDDSRSPRYIETVPTLGYRFVAAAREVDGGPPAAPPESNPPVADVRPPAGKRPSWVLSAMAVAILVLAGWWWTRRAAPPIAPGRSVATQITTTAGVDSRPSFGPDGRSFVYCSNRSGRFEIYRRELASEAGTKPVTDDGNQNVQPAWSPDGKWIAYHSVAQRGIWIVPAAGGTPRRLTQFGSTPSWSPDSQTIAFSAVEPVSLAPFDAGGTGNLWAVALDGAALRQLTAAGTPRGTHVSPSWSHDGKRIVYAVLARDSAVHILDVATGQSTPAVRIGDDIPRQPGTFVSRVWDPAFGPGDERIYFSAAGDKGEYSIWSAPAQGGPPARIHSSSAGTATGLALSPDGSKLLFTDMRNESQLWTVDERGETKPLFQESVLRAYLPSYSNDGKWLAFAVETQGRNRDMWIMPSGGGEPVTVSPDPGTKEGGMVWTPAGEFLYNYVDGSEVEFRAFDPATRKTRLLVRRSTVGLFHPALLPNGKQILASCSNPLNVCLGPATADRPRQLTFDRDGAWFAFADRSSQWIGYQVRRADFEQIGVIRTDGSENKILTSGPAKHWANAFSPDSRRIAYAAFQDGIWTLWWTDRATGERKQMTKESAFGPFVRSPAWRPGTDQIAYERYQVRGNIFALDLP